MCQRITNTVSQAPPDSRIQLLHDVERLIDRIVQLAVWHMAQHLTSRDPDFDQVSEAIPAIGRILELRVQVHDLIRQATTQGEREGPDSPSADHPEEENLSELATQREADHEDAPVSREVSPLQDTSE